MIGIYKITNPNNRIYIGQSTDIMHRWSTYKSLHCKDQPSLYNSLKKYTPQNHTFEIIEECSVEMLDEKEIYWGLKFDVLSNKHLNNRLGRGFGSFDSEETKLKKQLCHKGRSNYWLKGKNLSEEQCEKIRQGKLGKKHNVTKKRSDVGISKYNHVEAASKAKSKPVIQYDINGLFIKEWNSGKEAADILGFTQPNINLCCLGKKKSYKKFIWEFKIK
jgi:group I intron endonuclease